MTSALGPVVAAFKLPDLRRRILFVFGMFALFVVGRHIPVPNVQPDAAQGLVQGGLLALLDAFTGGALGKFSVLALGIMPYINASIIFQLFGIAIPRVAELAKEGESGRKKISQWTRWLTILLAVFQAVMLCTWMSRSEVPVLTVSGLELIPIIITLTAGTCFLMWMGEQITDKGIGNGISLIIFVGIVARMPTDVGKTYEFWRSGIFAWTNVLFLLVIWLFTIAGIIYITRGERRITIQSAKRVVGTRIYSGGSSYLPIRVNTAGVIPIIFAIAVIMLPGQIAQFMGGLGEPWGGYMRSMGALFSPGESWIASAFYFLLVVFFTYFYTAVTFNVADVSDNLKKYGSFIPGIRPGRPTERHLDRVLSRITLAGALFLGVIALLNYYVPDVTRVTTFTLVGGTSLLILVGVALDTVQQIEAHLVMRQYEGFIK
ncbi:MAG: preprotein translocase subunit SecY [Armatimonadota bacterium]|nr:MAG: preprotein translocase subunit SecY [Armatimonadota bacterium]